MSSLPAPRRARQADDLSRRCSAMSKRSGQQCRAWAMRGTNVCRMHGGRAPGVEAKRRKVVAQWEARRELTRLGAAVDVHPIDALLEMVREAAGNVAFLRGRVSALDQARGLVALPDDDERLFRQEGLYGPDHQGDGKRHILVAMYDEERERLARFSKMALDAGVEERAVRMAEAQGQQLAGVVRTAVRAAAAEGEEAGLRAAAEEMRRLRA